MRMKAKERGKPKDESLFWIFSVLFVMGGASGMSHSVIGGFLVFAAGVVLFPPFNNWLRDSRKIEMPGWARFLISVFLLGLGMAFLPFS